MNGITILLLLSLGMLGVVAQALKKMNELNRRSNGNFSFKNYIRIEVFSLALSVTIVFASVLFIYLVPEMAKAGKWLAFGQFAIGWFGQSGLEFVMGQAKKKIGLSSGATDDELKNLST